MGAEAGGTLLLLAASGWAAEGLAAGAGALRGAAVTAARPQWAGEMGSQLGKGRRELSKPIASCLPGPSAAGNALMAFLGGGGRELCDSPGCQPIVPLFRCRTGEKGT